MKKIIIILLLIPFIGHTQSKIELEFLKELNEYRKNSGLSELVYDSTISANCLKHNEFLRDKDYICHFNVENGDTVSSFYLKDYFLTEIVNYIPIKCEAIEILDYFKSSIPHDKILKFESLGLKHNILNIIKIVGNVNLKVGISIIITNFGYTTTVQIGNKY